RWEGDALVVETTNFNGRTGSYARNGDGNPTSTALRLIERFRLRDARTLLYEVRVDDPETWVRPWRVPFPLIARRRVRDVRVRLPRRKLRPAKYPERGPRRRAQ